MIHRSLSKDTISDEAKQHAAALLVLPDAAWTSEVEQLLLDQGVAVVRTRVTSKRLWQSLLRIGATVLLEGIAPEAARELAKEIPIEVLNTSGFTSETFFQQLREKGILLPQKASQQ
jgi:hypothetical protein